MVIVDDGKGPDLIRFRNGNDRRRSGLSPFSEGGDTEPISGIRCLQRGTTILKVARDICIFDKLNEDLETAIDNARRATDEAKSWVSLCRDLVLSSTTPSIRHAVEFLQALHDLVEECVVVLECLEEAGLGAGADG